VHPPASDRWKSTRHPRSTPIVQFALQLTSIDPHA
jgi:hypothetical protein